MAIFSSSCAEFGNPVTVVNAPEAEAPLTGQSWIDDELVLSAFNANGKRARPKTLSYSHGLLPHVGECFKMFGDLFWFGHLHVVPSSFDLGNVLSDQIISWDIFNGHRTSKQFSSITLSGAEGISLDGQPDDSPNLIGPLGTITVDAQVGTVGPVTIAFSSIYNFVSGEVLTLTITGNRVVIMTTEPQFNIDEDWDWYTDIITAASGKEQRISSRDVGRQRWTMRFTKEYQDLSWLENQLWAWAGNNWAIPVWPDYTQTTAALTADVDFVIPVGSTVDREFLATDTETVHLALLWLDEQTFEAVEVESFTGTTITVATTVLNDWPEGTYVMPLRAAKIPRDYKQNNPNYGARQFEVTWIVLEPEDKEQSPNPIFNLGTHQGLPIWDYEAFPFITGGTYNVQEDRNLQIFGDPLGRFSSFTSRKFPENRISGLRTEAFGRTEFHTMRAMFSYLRGRWKAVWVSTQQQDFTIESDTIAPSNVINVEEVNYTRLIWNAPDGPMTRQDIEIRYLDGTSDYRRIVNASVVEGTREVLTLDSGISQDTDQIERISWLIKRRLSSDQLKFQHRWYENETEAGPFGFTDVIDDDI